MTRRVRIATVSSLGVAIVVVVILALAYCAVRQVRPFYQQAIAVEAPALEQGSREMESRATALYSEARQTGPWSAIFTADQINGWLAMQLTKSKVGELPEAVRDPRIAISPNQLTLGFRTSPGGVETVASVDAAVFLTDDGAVAVRLTSVQAGALPLPVMQVAHQLAAACRELSLPVRWRQEDGQPVAIIELRRDSESNKRQYHIDAVELGDGQLYIAGHTEPRSESQVASQSQESAR